METILTIQLTNRKALNLIKELEVLHLIKILKENLKPAKTKLSDKYQGVFTKEDAKSFDAHTNSIRGGWARN